MILFPSIPTPPDRALPAFGYSKFMIVNPVFFVVASMSKRATIVLLLIGGLVSMISVYLYLAWELDGDYVKPLAVRKIRKDAQTGRAPPGNSSMSRLGS